VPRLVHFSSSCAVRPLQDAYGKTKWLGEQALKELSGLDLRTFRPAMMYGEGSREWFTFVSTVARFPLVPVPGDGRHLLRPVLVDDAVQATLAAVERDGLGGRIYDIVSREALDLNQLIGMVAGQMGKRRWPLHLPLSLVLAGARLMGRIWTHPPVVPDQVLAFAQDTEGDPEPAARDLGFAPVGMAQGLRTLFQRTPWRQMGQLSPEGSSRRE
jgi:NADH dehydrogenase